MGIKLVNFREAQNQALNLDLVGMIPTIDIGDDYNVHPANKHDVGYRLAVASDFWCITLRYWAITQKLLIA